MHLSTPPAHRRDTGFTLLEVLIAILLVASVAMGVAQLFAWTMIATENARHQTSSTALAVQKMEELRALTWAFGPGGGALSDMSTNLSTDPATTAGPGLSVSPAGTLSTNTSGTSTISTPADDGWARDGCRRASLHSAVERRGATLDPDTLVLQVLVTTVRRDREAPAREGRGSAAVATRS